MDASQYKDYILTLLFVKYVTDKFKGVKYADITVPEGGSFDDLVALKGNKNIGEEMDKVIAKLAEAGENNLRGVIDNAHFNDEAKLGSGKEMVDKLTGLIAIFQRDEFNFKKNKASGDDILGDAYEYLMRHFATESGKSKGQFYTPAEVSRILAKVIGIDSIEERDEGYSVYDPACGSGSLLIRAADEAPFEIAIWGQEKEVTTAGLAKMNLVLHNKAAGEMRERVNKIAGMGAESVWVSTFHSACVRILRRHIEVLGFSSNFTIYDADDQKTVMKEVFRKFNINTKIYKERAVLGEISHAKDELITPEEMELNAGSDPDARKIAGMYKEYQSILRGNNAKTKSIVNSGHIPVQAGVVRYIPVSPVDICDTDRDWIYKIYKICYQDDNPSEHQYSLEELLEKIHANCERELHPSLVDLSLYDLSLLVSSDKRLKERIKK